MADYHAVLQRTLSGFTNPKPELRIKLYDRARTTIERQLKNRTPPVAGEALKSELGKLEEAITQVERKYDPTYGIQPSVAARPSPEPVATGVSSAGAPEPAKPRAPVAPPQPSLAPRPETPAAAPPPPPQSPPPAPPPQQVQPAPAPVAPDSSVQQPGFEPLQPPVAAEPIGGFGADPNAGDAAANQWADEFASHQPHPQSPPPLPPHGAGDPPLPDELQPAQPYGAPADAQWHPQHQADPGAAQVYYEQPHPAPGQEYAQPYGEPVDESLAIPPAAGFGNGGKKKRRKWGFFKWFFMLLFLGALGAGGYYGWMNKELVLEKVEQTGLMDLFDDPTKPKPVKTIAITPPEDAGNETVPAPKVESRLNENGQEETVPASDPVSPSALQPVVEAPATDATPEGSLLVAQNAILYEEGSTAAENTVDSGRVVWSVVEEEPANGTTKEPVIRARIEVPERNVVLIMKIKRNADKALPASHLIELVFAVPDNFSGGSIDQVSRFVLKQSEQGRGDGLIGVPARIADGIFLIALNNLEQAREQNESLLKSRDWIDIPLQYSTGRRALMTIEKGLPGNQVFERVFEAWSKL